MALITILLLGYSMLVGLGVFAIASLIAKRVIQAVICCLVLGAAIGVPAVSELLPAVFLKRAGRSRNGEMRCCLAMGPDLYREISAFRTPEHDLHLLILYEGGIFPWLVC